MMPCAPCFRPRCIVPERYRCLRAVRVEDVYPNIHRAGAVRTSVRQAEASGIEVAGLPDPLLVQHGREAVPARC